MKYFFGRKETKRKIATCSLFSMTNPHVVRSVPHCLKVLYIIHELHIGIQATLLGRKGTKAKIFVIYEVTLHDEPPCCQKCSLIGQT